VPAASPKAMLLSVERPDRGSLCTWAFKGHAAVPKWSGVSSPAGVGLEHVQTDNCGSPGTWENPARSSATSRLEIPGYQLQALAAHSSVRERKQRVQPRYRQTKETKCGGMAAGRHSVLIVLTKLANSTRLEPAEESETPIHGTVFEKHDECIEIR